MKALFVTCSDFADDTYGGVKGSLRNYKTIKNFAEIDIYTIKKRSNVQSGFALLKGYYPPIDSEDNNNIDLMLREGKYDFVFYDGSYFGKLIFNNRHKDTKSVVFYHNCEQDYLEVRFGKKFSFRKILYGLSINKNESLATKYADYRIVLSERDKKRIEELYSVIPEGMLPLAIVDQYQKREKEQKEKSCLLFGPIGTANEEAFQWFVSKVSPYLNCKTIVAGRGFEKYADIWKTEHVNVIGTVDDIAQLYADVSCVAIPLLSGGGMKIKTAEAMMFGKYIFGTDEAYSGFNLEYEKIGAVCNNASEFIEAINKFIETDHEEFNKYAREQYDFSCSIESSINVFGKMLNEFIK